MNPIRLLCLLSLAAALPSLAADRSYLQRLQGRWEVAPEVREVLAANCQLLTYEIDASTITLRSGGLLLVTRYEAETPGPEILLRRTVVSNNGERNCYGAVVVEAAGQKLEKMQIDLVEDPLGDRLRVHQRGSRGGNRSFEMVRSAK